VYDLGETEFTGQLRRIEATTEELEKRCEEELTAMERVRIVRSPFRFSFKDILENVY